MSTKALLSTFVLRLSLSRSFVETTMKANRMCPRKRHWSELAGKCINNCTRGRSRKRAELIVYYFRRRHLWGSKLHVGYSIHLRFYHEWSAIWGRCPKKNRVRPYHNGYMTGGAASYVGLRSGSSDHISLLRRTCGLAVCTQNFKGVSFWLQPCG